MALALTDDTETSRWRIVEGGVAGINAALHHDSPSSGQRAVQACIAWGLMRRVGRINSPRTMLLVDVAAAKTQHHCEGCGGQAKKRFCDMCRLTLQRKDRAWQPAALAMAVHQIATNGDIQPGSISVRLNVPLMRALDDNDEAKAGGGSSVIAYLYRVALEARHGPDNPFTDAWERFARAYGQALVEVAGQTVNVRGSARQLRRRG